MEIKNIEDLKAYAKHLESYARVPRVLVCENKKVYMDGILVDSEERAEYYKDYLKDFDDTEVVIEILYPNGEPTLYHEADMKEIENDLLVVW